MKTATKGDVRTMMTAAKNAMKRASFDIRHGRVSDLGQEVDLAMANLGAIRELIDRGQVPWKTTCAVVKEGGQVCGLLVAPGYRDCLIHRGPNQP